MKKIKFLVLALVVVAGVLGAPAVASADTGVGSNGEFLCPIVGAGVTNADDNNGDHGVSTIGPAAGVSLLPGNNQAGNHADSNALNDLPPNDPNSGPGGGNSGFGAIWPAGG